MGEIISLTFNLYFSKFLQFFLPFLIAGITIGLLSYAIYLSFPLPVQPELNAPPEELIEWIFAFFSNLIARGVLSGLVSWVVSVVANGFAVKYVSDNIEKGEANLSASFNFALSKLILLLIAQLIFGVLLVIGLLLFIIPGIIIAIMFSLIVPSIIIEQKGVFESLGRSKKLVSNRWLKTFALLVILGIISLVVGGVALVLATPFESVLPEISILITNVISAFVTPISPIAMTYLYYAMVAREIPPPPPPPTL